MKNKIALILSILLLGCGLTTNAVVSNSKTAPVKAKTEVGSVLYQNVKPSQVVANPSAYLNKHIKMHAFFDKFSTLGLDYKPAYRSSEKYITVLIKRDDVINHTVPLSEMKIFLNRKEAEKYIDLNPNDEVVIEGYVFSNALGDVWVEAEKFSVINQKKKEDVKK